MKKEQLLEAIGEVSEEMLLACEQTPAKGTRTLRRLVLVAAAVALLAITAAAGVGLFSRPIGETEIVFGETIAPFYMDAQGNIIPSGVEGIKITMEVQMDQDRPTYLEEIYHLELSEDWQWSGGSGGMGLYTYFAWSDCWAQEGKPGELRLHQSVSDKTEETQLVVDLLEKLTVDASSLSAEKTKVAGMEVLKLVIPAQPGYTGTKYCPEGETRLYWSDGQYLLQLDYPSWVSDKEAEKMLKTLNPQEYVVPLPEDYGLVNTERLSQLNPDFFVEKGKTGTAMANSVMGWGRFAYIDNVVYYGNDGKIIGYDLETRQVKTYPLETTSSTLELFATENYICYEDMRDALMAVPKQGGEAIPIYQGLGITHLYADGPVLYTNNGSNYLSRIDLESGKVERLVDNANSYYVDDTYIYVVQTGADENYFLRSQKDVIDFKKIPLSFHPIKVIADGQDLYFCRGGKGYDYQVIHYRNGVETPLGIYAYDYQVFDDKLFYHDEKEEWVIRSYDLQTGEITVMQERCHDFAIMNDRYIGFTCVDGKNHPYPKILDTQTGETYEPDITD